MDTYDLIDDLTRAFDTPINLSFGALPEVPINAPVIHTSHLKAPTSTPWDSRLVLDLALGVDSLQDILDRYDLNHEEYNALSTTPAFRRDLAQAIKDIREDGLSFSTKARIQAETYLPILDEMVNSLETPASVRLEAIRSTVAWGRLEPKNSKGDEVKNATQINVNINF